MDVNGLEDIKRMVNDSFLENCMDRFLKMREDWQQAFVNKDKSKL